MSKNNPKSPVHNRQPGNEVRNKIILNLCALVPWLFIPAACRAEAPSEGGLSRRSPWQRRVTTPIFTPYNGVNLRFAIEYLRDCGKENQDIPH
jgi:hypothetical protein